MAIRKQIFSYNEDFLKSGFTSVEVNGEVRLQCVLCLEVLTHSSLKKLNFNGTLNLSMKSTLAKITKPYSTLAKIKSKELQAKTSRIDCPSIWGGVDYSLKDAVRASFSVA